MRRLLLSLAVLCIGATCGDADPDVIDVGPGDDPGAHEPPVHRIRMGPLANAGPDQFALPGMPVRLDGRGTTPPEDGRPLRYRWLQEAGPRVLLSDPTSPVTEFVAPSIRPGSGDRLVFRLVVEDGAARSVDRMVVRLVESSDRLEFAPAVIAGAEIETRPGQEVEIPPPTFLATACLDREDREKCLATPLPYCWSQVAGPRVALQGACGEGPTYFSAPAVEGLLVFRVDAHAHADSPAPSACGPEADIAETPPCAAPDYLRVVVRAVPRRGEELPTTSLGVRGQSIGPHEAETIELGGVLNDIPAQLDAVGSGDDRAERWRFVPRFRAVLGQPRLRPLPGQADLLLGIEGNRAHVYSPPWPGLVGVVFEPWFYTELTQGGQTRLEWMRAAPSLAILRWTHPVDLPRIRTDAGPRPCGTSSVPPDCEPLEPGQEVVLSGSVESSAPGSPTPTCWEQTFGPPVDLSPAACAANEPRRFVAPQPPPDRPLELAFRFYPQDASLFESLPATLTLQVRPTNLLPPRIVLESPAAVAPGGSDTLDATGSSDPHGGLVRFRWRQVSGPTAFLGPCGNEDATEGCRVLTLPEDATGLLVLELEVLSEATGLVTRRRVEIPVVEGAP